MESFIKESREIICKASKNNKLIVFVGAGVSVNSGYPSWLNLISEFAMGLGIDLNSSSVDDYLKIPQYYYNLRKSKEYYDVILNKFNINAIPNKIHELILELEPAHIITTNYDNLIEDTARKKGLFYDVVAKDSDLPYSINNKMIIKMHGDLDNKNIVLKEDDYLSYFKNFQLIQNYIKSLLSTHIVLFIGYSISDINVKYIFQWVKDILKNDFQQVYFFENSENKEFTQLEFEYYRNRGVNILYSSAFRDIKYFNKSFNYGEIKDERAKSTVKFLNYLIENDINKNLTIDIAYEKLKILDGLNFVLIENITEILNLLTPYDYNGYRMYSNCKLEFGELTVYRKELLDLFKELNQVNFNKKKKVLMKIFYNAGVRKVINKDREVIVPVIECENHEIDDDIYLFNYNNLMNRAKYFMISDVKNREKESLNLAYYLYKLGKYYEAYIILKKISESCIENKLYYLYFVSEFNRYYLGWEISQISFFNIRKLGIDIVEQDKIRNEIRKIDLNNIYLKLPKNYQSNISIYRDILTFKFSYTRIRDVISYEKKIEKEKDTIFIGAKENEGTIYELKNNMKLFCDFITRNRLFVDNYTEVKVSFYKFIETLLFSYSLEDKIVKDTVCKMEGKRVKINKIDNFILYSMINYLSYEELKYLIRKYCINKLNFEDNVMKNLCTINYNFLYALSNIEGIIKLEDKYCNFLYIISMVNIPKDNLSNIINNVLSVLKNNYKKFNSDIIESFGGMLLNQNNLYSNNIDYEILQSLINICFNLIQQNIKNERDILLKISELINKIISILHKNNIYLNVINEKLIIDYIKKEENLVNNYNIIINLYNIISSKSKNIIKRRIIKILKNKNEFSYNEYLLYKLSLYNEIIKPEQENEEKLFAFIDSEIQEKDDQEKNGIYSEKIYDIESLLMGIFYLLANDYILNADAIMKYSDKNIYIKFIIDNMNIELLDVKWINDFPKNLHLKLNKNDNIKNKIKEYVKSNLNDIKTVETYFRYYC